MAFLRSVLVNCSQSAVRSRYYSSCSSMADKVRIACSGYSVRVISAMVSPPFVVKTKPAMVAKCEARAEGFAESTLRLPQERGGEQQQRRRRRKWRVVVWLLLAGACAHTFFLYRVIVVFRLRRHARILCISSSSRPAAFCILH